MDPLAPARTPSTRATRAATPTSTCEFCRLPIHAGEEHGVIGPGEDGRPGVVCRILRVKQVLEEVPTT